MHIHVSWLTVLIHLLEFLVVVGSVNFAYNTWPNLPGKSVWTAIATPNA